MDGIQRRRPFPLAQFSLLLVTIVAGVTLIAALPIWPALLVFAVLASTVAYLSKQQRRASLESLLAFEPSSISAVTPESMEIELSRIAKAAINGDDPFPPYVHRGSEDNRIRASLKKHRTVIVVGNRYAGKTRAALEAMRGRRSKLLLLRRASEKDNPLRALLSAHWLLPKRLRCVLLVERLDTYLDGIDPHDLDAWLAARPKTALIATISAKALHRALDPNSDSFDRNKRLLDSEKCAVIADEIGGDVLERARAIYGADPELTRLGSYLGGGLAVEHRYAHARDFQPAVWGIVTAAVTAARTGIAWGIEREALLELARRLGLVGSSMTDEELNAAIELCCREHEGIMGMLITEERPDGEPLLRANSLLVGDDLESPGVPMSLDTWKTVAGILAQDQASCVAIAHAAWLHASGKEAPDITLVKFARDLLRTKKAGRNIEPEAARVATSLAPALVRALNRKGPPEPLQRPKPLPIPDRAQVNEVIKRRGIAGDDSLFEPAMPAYTPAPAFYTNSLARNTLRSILLGACDLLSIALGIALGVVISNHAIGGSEPLESIGHGAIIALPLLIVLFAYLGLYRPDSKRARLPEIVNAMCIATFVLVLVAMAEGFEPSALFLILASTVSASAIVFLYRLAYDLGSGKWVRKRGLVARTLFVAPAKSVRLSADLVRQTSRRPMQFVGFVSSKKAADRAQLSTLAEFDAVLAEFFVDHVILADPALPTKKRAKLVATCHEKGVRVEIFPSAGEIIQEGGEALRDLSVPLIGIPPPYLSRFSARVKRTFDLVLALALLVPVLALTAIMVFLLWLLSVGKSPIEQLPRLGVKGTSFSMYRFRLDADFGFAEWINAFMRRTHLDELPQFYNVLHGEMSLVGPRPLNEREYLQLGNVQRQRYAVKPGLTGLWQVTRRNHKVHDEFSPLALMTSLDLVYCQRWSPLLDFTIVLRTPWAFFRAPQHA